MNKVKGEGLTAKDYKAFFNGLASKQVRRLTSKEVNMCRDICIFIEQHFKEN